MQLSIPTSPVFLQPTIAGGQYVVEIKNSLGDTNWQTLQTINGDGLVHTILDSVSASPRHFYRVRFP